MLNDSIYVLNMHSHVWPTNGRGRATLFSFPDLAQVLSNFTETVQQHVPVQAG